MESLKNVKIISKGLFFITKILAIIYIAISLYSAISVFSGWSFLVKDDGKRFAVCYPFTQTPFLNGENNWGYMLFNFLLPLGFYGIFFLLTSNVFKVFFQPKLFTENGIRQLKYFYIANIFALPLIILFSKMITGKIDEGLDTLAVIHFILGIFAYFLAAIFRQGLQLQNEQDLFI
jgi:hypothetical protein